jgi:hypothetical protein
VLCPTSESMFLLVSRSFDRGFSFSDTVIVHSSCIVFKINKDEPKTDSNEPNAPHWQQNNDGSDRCEGTIQCSQKRSKTTGTIKMTVIDKERKREEQIVPLLTANRTLLLKPNDEQKNKTKQNHASSSLPLPPSLSLEEQDTYPKDDPLPVVTCETARLGVPSSGGGRHSVVLAS